PFLFHTKNDSVFISSVDVCPSVTQVDIGACSRSCQRVNEKDEKEAQVYAGFVSDERADWVKEAERQVYKLMEEKKKQELKQMLQEKEREQLEEVEKRMRMEEAERRLKEEEEEKRREKEEELAREYAKVAKYKEMSDVDLKESMKTHTLSTTILRHCDTDDRVKKGLLGKLPPISARIPKRTLLGITTEIVPSGLSSVLSKERELEEVEEKEEEGDAIREHGDSFEHESPSIHPDISKTVSSAPSDSLGDSILAECLSIEPLSIEESVSVGRRCIISFDLMAKQDECSEYGILSIDAHIGWEYIQGDEISDVLVRSPVVKIKRGKSRKAFIVITPMAAGVVKGDVIVKFGGITEKVNVIIQVYRRGVKL
ncbi:hypothetical protein ADUPG1_000109, partial [Aduncisulcus paluster]